MSLPPTVTMSGVFLFDQARGEGNLPSVERIDGETETAVELCCCGNYGKRIPIYSAGSYGIWSRWNGLCTIPVPIA